MNVAEKIREALGWENVPGGGNAFYFETQTTKTGETYLRYLRNVGGKTFETVALIPRQLAASVINAISHDT